MTCRMDNQTGNKSEQTYRCQNEVDVECSLFLHDYYMLGLAGTVRGDTMTCRMDNQTGNKSEQTYRCQNEVDVECSLFLHDYYMLGLAGTVRGSTWTIYGFCGSRLEIFLLFSKRAG